MSTLTPNYGLHLPENTDSMDDFFTNYESDMTTIDDHLGGGGGATIEEMTQAEYEALPDTKLTDGILRGLKDVKSFLDADILYLGACYSTSERMVGCWIDGKPLYQKTIGVAPLPNSGTKEIQLDNDIEKIISMNGYAIDGNDKWDIFFNDVVPTNNNASIRVYTNTITKKLYITTAVDLRSYTEACITLQYTKTTDVAGSGTWTPSGVNAVHYDTNEQVIGTYLGETLYEKTFNVGTASFDSNLQISIANGLSNIKYIVDYGGSAKEPRDNRNIPLPYFRKSWNESIVPQIMQLPDGTVSMAIVTNDSFYTSLQNIVLWVRYTKSS